MYLRNGVQNRGVQETKWGLRACTITDSASSMEQARSQGEGFGDKPPREMCVKNLGIYFGLHPAIMYQNASFQHQNPTAYSLLQNVLWYCLYSFSCTKFSKLILRKFIKIVAKRRQILRQKCTKFDVGWGFAPYPAGGAYSAPPDPLAGSNESYF